MTSDLRFFRRFREVTKGPWKVGRGKWDTLKFIPTKDVLIVGASVFESYPSLQRDFKCGYKFELEEANGILIRESPPYVDEVTGPQEVQDHMINLKWKSLNTGVIVKRGQKFIYSTWLEFKDGCDKCWYADTGVDPGQIQNQDQGLFALELVYNRRGNSTSVSTGVIPGLLYHLLE